MGNLLLLGCPKEEVCSAGEGPPSETAVPSHFRQAVAPDALARGFRVSEFALRRNSDTDEYSFVVPPNTVFVTCALFVGKPDIVVGPPRIANGGEVMPRLRTYETRGGEELVFSLGSLRFREMEWFDCSRVPITPYLVEGTWMGCWASDGVSISAATELVPIEPAAVPQTLPPVPTCLADDLSQTADRLCPLDTEIGVCVASECVADDSTEASDGGTADIALSCGGDSAGHRCVLKKSERLGRCRAGYCAPEPLSGNLPADQLVVQCSPETDGFSCKHPQLGTFGTCYTGRCRQRCNRNDTANIVALDALDCAPDGFMYADPRLASETACSRPSPVLPINVCIATQELALQ